MINLTAVLNHRSIRQPAPKAPAFRLGDWVYVPRWNAYGRINPGEKWHTVRLAWCDPFTGEWKPSSITLTLSASEIEAVA